MPDNNEFDEQLEGDTAVAEETELQEPKQFQVILLNDDYTSMDFVVAVLEGIFNKAPAEAVRIMMKVHKEGEGLCGVYARQIAETKVAMVHVRAEEANYPLRCIMRENV